jgi:hypothetical protein
VAECILLLTTDFNSVTLKMVKVPTVLVFMTIDTQIFPIAAVEWIVIMVVVLVVNSQKVQIFVGELSTTTGTYPGMDFQGLLPIALFMLSLSLTGFSHNTFDFIFIDLTPWWLTRSVTFNRH